MRVTVTLCRQTEKKSGDDKGDDTFLFGREHEPVLELVPFPTFGKFQRGSCFSHDRIRSER